MNYCGEGPRFDTYIGEIESGFYMVNQDKALANQRVALLSSNTSVHGPSKPEFNCLYGSSRRESVQHTTSWLLEIIEMACDNKTLGLSVFSCTNSVS